MGNRRGFTLIELIVVLAIMTLIAGATLPLITATKKAQRVDRVESELEGLAVALSRYYYEHAHFPASLTATDFVGVFLRPGAQQARLLDEFRSTQYYRVARTSDPDTFTVYSVGENGLDDGATNEVFRSVVDGALPGNTRTRERMRIIAAALAVWLGGGGTPTGNWSADRAAMGLGVEYERDGFGTPFRLDAATRVLRSAGADRSFSTVDDLVI